MPIKWIFLFLIIIQNKPTISRIFYQNNNIKIFRFDNNAGMSYLKLEGQFTVFEQFFPLLSTSGNPAHNFYWKNYQFDNLKKISLIVKANLHTSLFGIRAI